MTTTLSCGAHIEFTYRDHHRGAKIHTIWTEFEGICSDLLSRQPELTFPVLEACIVRF